MQHDYRRELQIRVAWLFLIVTALMGLALLRLAYLQLWQGSHLAGLALGQRFRGEIIEPERGKIVDRHHVPLAMSVYADAVYARPDRVGNPAETAARLAPLLGMAPAEIERRLGLDSPSVLIAARLEPEQAAAVRDARLPGVSLLPRPQRFYPHNELASHVLGFAGVDNQGLEGLEFYYDEWLRGIPGRRLAERDPQGRSIPEGKEEVIPPVTGHHLVLTIDHTLQYTVEKHLREAVEATRAAWGVILTVKPSTGEILAVAQYPTFDPNDVVGAASRFRNRAFSDQVEPGSTFKAVVAAIAYELGIVRPDDLFDGVAELHIGGGRVRCWRYPRGFGLLTFEQALAHSCNTVFARLGGEMIPPADLVRYLRAFGFGERTGVDFPGEATGFIPTPGRIHGEVLRWANVSFGQGLSVTPLQLTMAIAALVNDGKLMRPYLVREIRDAGGRTVWYREPEVVRQVVSPRTAEQMRRALETAVVEGTGSLAAIDGFRVLGKTGTAEIPVPGGYGDGRVASFIGAAPAENPQVVTLVVLYDVGGEVRFGGQLAAPLFATVTERVLEQMGVTRRGREGAASTVASTSPTPVLQPRRDPLPAPRRLSERGPGGSAPPSNDSPDTGRRGAESVAGDWWNLGGDESGGSVPVPVPDVRGQTIRAAVDILEGAGLRIRVEGSGIAVAQEPEPGRSVPAQTPVVVRFEHP